ncbi:MAG: TonB family protein [Acidobacteriota bacterium]
MRLHIGTIQIVAIALLAFRPPCVESAAREDVAVVSTPFGEIVWRFLPEHAPGHTAYVQQLIRGGFYDGTTFHRVIPYFVVQGGDPNTKNSDRSDDGEGDSERTLKAEFSQDLHYRPGTVGMARGADPDSGSCQFFIALENIPRLDGKYTIFGEVISGLDVARMIADQPRDLNDNPIRRIPVTIRIEKREVPKKILSLDTGESGEVLTGPTKPRPFDSGNVLFKAPALRPAASATASPALGRMDLAVDAAGKVLDVRFVDSAQKDAERLRSTALGWSFEPAEYNGTRVKVRIEINSDGSAIGPTTGGGAPMEIGGGVQPPRPVIAVVVSAEKRAPDRPALMRLTIDPTGRVTDVALQSSCGDSDLDAAAAQAAFAMLFEPATRNGSDGPEPIAVYLNVQARFTAGTR